MNVPNVMPNMPTVLPGMPGANPGAPIQMQSQQAGKVQLGCGACQMKGFKGYAAWPMWAKIGVPVGIIGGLGVVTALIVSVARR